MTWRDAEFKLKDHNISGVDHEFFFSGKSKCFKNIMSSIKEAPLVTHSDLTGYLKRLNKFFRCGLNPTLALTYENEGDYAVIHCKVK